MNKPVNVILICMIVVASCKNKLNSYENAMGIKPASLAGLDTANYTRIEWEDTVKNFGTVHEGDSVLLKYKFKNTGNTVLYILEVLPSCGCTVADYPSHAIQPGDEGIISARFDTQSHPGKVTKSIMVKTNTIHKTVQNLEFSGEVTADKPETDQ